MHSAAMYVRFAFELTSFRFEKHVQDLAGRCMEARYEL